jgi:hypothetical protein
MKRTHFASGFALLLALFTLCLTPMAAGAQTQQNLATVQTSGESYQVGVTWSAWTTTSPASSSSFNVAGIHYFALSWSSSGTLSGCTVTLDGNPGNGTFTSGSLVPSQTCTSSGSITISVPNNSFMAKLSPAITGTGSVIFTVTGYDVLPLAGTPLGINATRNAFITPATATTTQIVAAAAGKTIYVTAWYLGNGATAQTVIFQSGTGSSCATGEAAVSPTFALPASTPGVVMGDGSAVIFSAGLGNALCATTSAASSTPIMVTYQQF